MKNTTTTPTTTMTKVDNNTYGGKKIFYRLSTEENNVFDYCREQGIAIKNRIILAHGTPNKKTDGTEKTTYRFVICESIADAYCYVNVKDRRSKMEKQDDLEGIMSGARFYEVIDPDRRCHPYFDIEFVTKKRSRYHTNMMMEYIGRIVHTTRELIREASGEQSRWESMMKMDAEGIDLTNKKIARKFERHRTESRESTDYDGITYNDFTVYTSCGKVSSGYKYSYHIVVDGATLDCYANCHQLFKDVKKKMEEVYEKREPFFYIDPKKNVAKCSMDSSVYSNYRQFRMINNSKDGTRTKTELVDREGSRYTPYYNEKGLDYHMFDGPLHYSEKNFAEGKTYYSFARSLISPVGCAEGPKITPYYGCFSFICEEGQVEIDTQIVEEMMEKLQQERPDIASELKLCGGSYLQPTCGHHTCHVNGDNADDHKGAQRYSLFATKWGYHLCCLSCCMDAEDNPSIKKSMRFFSYTPAESEAVKQRREARESAKQAEQVRLEIVYAYERNGLEVPEMYRKPTRPVYPSEESIRAALAPGSHILRGYDKVSKFEDDGVNDDEEQEAETGPDGRGWIHSSLQQNEDKSMERTGVYQRFSEDEEPGLEECKIKPYSYMGLRGKYKVESLSALAKPLAEPIICNSMLDCYLEFADRLYEFLAAISPFYKINMINDLVVWDIEKTTFKPVGVIKGIKAGCVTISMSTGFEGTKPIQTSYTVEELMNARFLQKYRGNKKMRCYIRAIESLNLHLTSDNICRLPYFKGSKVPLYSKEGVNTSQGYKAVTTDKKHKDLDNLLYFVKMGYCSGNEEHYDMLMRFLHAIMTNSFDPRTQKCFFNKGPQGVGKSQFIEWLINCVFGRNHACTMGIHNMFNKFNGSRAEKVLILIDEPNIANMGKNAPSRANARAEFKKLITEFFIEVERKGEEIFTGQNLNNYIINSNLWKNPLVDPEDVRRWIFLLSRAMSLLPSGVFIYADNVDFINACYDDGTPLTEEDEEISRKMGKGGHHAAFFSGPNAFLRSLFNDSQNLANSFVTYILNYDTKGRDIRSMCQSKNDVVRKEALSNLEGNFGNFAKALENEDGYLWLSSYNPPAKIEHDDKEDYRHGAYFVTNEQLYAEYKCFVDTYHKSMANIDKLDDFKAYFDDLCTYREVKTTTHKCFSKCGSTVLILTNPEDDYPIHKFSKPTNTRCKGAYRAGYFIKVKEIYGRSSKVNEEETDPEETKTPPVTFVKSSKVTLQKLKEPEVHDDDKISSIVSEPELPEVKKKSKYAIDVEKTKDDGFWSKKKTTIKEAKKIPKFNIIPADIPDTSALQQEIQRMKEKAKKQEEEMAELRAMVNALKK